ncbi:MAG TPA: ATP-binding cassette domain-containing protein [Gammaproteobacteria bacterium]|nr:ATP-binding cassette domain-containing protein [Gammaproteobacteria bacterium]
MTTAHPVLRAIALTKKVNSPEGELTILEDFGIEIAEAESVAVVGPSGAGKSTLLALLAGLDSPTEGQVWLGDTQMSALDEDGRARLRNERVGFVFQSFHLLQSLTAIENVMLPLELDGAADARAKARTALVEVGLGHRLTHYPRQLSGGEQQRVAIARAFVTSPQILFADEPTGNLDKKTGDHILEILFELNKAAGTTLVLVTHDAAAAALCERTVELLPPE